MPAKVLLPTFGPSLRVNIHPLVLFSICDAYIRRSEKQERVIGTLLGVISDGVVEVKNCYVVPHNESADQVTLVIAVVVHLVPGGALITPAVRGLAQVLVDIAHHKAMLDLHAKVASGDIVVGW